MSYLTFYNVEGRNIAWISDTQGYPTISLLDGTPVAWIADDAVYDYSGNYLGWFQDGWVRDRTGNAVFFTKEAAGGPVKPARLTSIMRGTKTARPARGAREVQPTRPARTSSWSLFSDESFFTP